MNMENNLYNKDMPKTPSLYQKISLMVFGLFLTIVILEIGLHIGGFTILSLQEHRNLESIKQKGSFRIMCLGESTTQNQYPSYLEEILNQHNIGIKFSVIDKGIVGINTVAILAQLEANLDKYQPDMVITMMGCNDGKGIMYYRDISEVNTGIFKHCRAYRFGRLIYMHILTKLKKEGIYRVNNVSASIKTKSASKGDKKDLIAKDIHQNDSELLERERKFKKAIELNPKDNSAYEGLGQLYKIQGKFAESEQTFKKAIEFNPNNDSAYLDLGLLCRDQGQLYRDQEKLIEAEQLLKKAIELNPNNEAAYSGLGRFYIDQRRFTEAEQLFKKAIEFNSNNETAYRDLGLLYKEQRKFTEAEQSFKKALELNLNNEFAYRDLNQLYKDQNKLTEAEQSFKKAIELNPNNANLYGGLAIIYCEMGNNRLFKEYAEKADNLRNKYSNPETVNNYQTLKRILDKRNIKLVCVQYPMRNIKPLKRIFEEEAPDDIIFVDNEKIFKDAVEKTSYKEYFRDMFGGDFGHCTDKGNNLLAENIANTILKGVFGK